MIRGKRGGILLYMLGIVTLLSIIVTEFLMEAATTIRYRSQIVGRQDLEIIAHSALEQSLAVIAEIKELDEGLYSPVQGWGNPIKYAEVFTLPSGYTVKVIINDETGKFSIYEEKLDDFESLLTEMKISYEIITNLKSEIKKYLDKFKEKESKSSNNEKNKPKDKTKEEEKEGENALSQDKDRNEDKNVKDKDKEKEKEKKKEEKKAARTLYSFDQLKEIPIFKKTFFDAKGNPNSNFQILKDNVSIFNTGKVNINTAPPIVKKIIIGPEGLGPAAGGKKFFKSMQDLGRSEDEARFGFKANIFDIEIEVMRGPVKYHLSAIVDYKDVNKESKKPSKEPEKVPEGQQKPPSGSKPEETQKPSEAGNGSSKSEKSSENKGNFSFLALTEDDSLVK